MPKLFLCRDWTDSFKVNALDAYAERFFLRLMMRADDFGIFHSDPLLLKTALFPLLPDIRVTDIPRWLAACEKAGLLHCYVAANGRRYLQVLNFKQRRQWMKSEHPPPEGQIGLALPVEKNSAGNTRSRSRREAERAPASEKPPARPSCAHSSPPAEEIKAGTKSPEPNLAPPVAKARREMWQLLADEEKLSGRITAEKNKQTPDHELVTILITQRKTVRDEMKKPFPS